ncbi:MAG: dihydrodipicolinate synthase family protein [Clostridia bacterium]|nr:dihydrodipicolinate synthase family protein [Clostridia bacterium]
MKKDFRSCAVTVTPFSKGVIPDFDEIAKQTELFKSTEIDAVFPCASTGEYPAVSSEDKHEIFRITSEVNKGAKAIVAGACDASLDGVISYMETAKKYDYDACVICPPYYYPQSQSDILSFYKNVAKASEGMPVIAYHVPFFTTGIELSTYEKLLEIPEIVGIKDSSANMKRIAHCCDLASKVRSDFKVFSGTDDCLFPALCAGCKGSMTALAATMPEKIAAIYDAFDKKDMARAMEINKSILEIIRLCDSIVFPIGYKMLAKAVGVKTEDIKNDEEKRVYDGILSLLKIRSKK